jgi:hypothetical protein
LGALTLCLMLAGYLHPWKEVSLRGNRNEKEKETKRRKGKSK